MRALIIALALIVMPGCAGPFLFFPGGSLAGEIVEQPVSDWSFVTDRFVEIETRPAEPYSVVVQYTVKDGALYIDPAEARTWHQYIREDPRVTVRFDGKLYPLKAVLVGQPGELEGFPKDRFIYRLDPRDGSS